MKPFNLEEAKVGKPVTTITSLDPREIFYGRDSIVVRHSEGLLLEHDENGIPLPTADGRCYDRLKLAMAPERKTAWVNIYRKENTDAAQGFAWPSRERADCVDRECLNEKRIACIPITYTEGEGL